MNSSQPNTGEANAGVSLSPLAFYIALAPIVTAHLCYWIGAGITQTLPECLVYWDGCTSISATGRNPPGSFIFRPVFIAHGVLLAIFWWLATAWLRGLGLRSGWVRAAAWVGPIGGLFLILYTTFLGSSGDFYFLMRRYGVTVYFAFTILAALLMAHAIINRFGWSSDQVAARMARRQILLCVALLVLGLASIPAGNFMPDDSRLNNAIEWTLSVLMQLNFVFYGLAWDRLKVRFALTHATPG